MIRLAVLALLLSACSAKDDYVRKSKMTEGRLMLHKLAKAAKSFVDEKGTLPTGTIGPTPAQPCCSSPDKKCAADLAAWDQPLWRDLMMSNDMPSYFQYSYQSDGTTFTATATGDMLCDGSPTKFTITGKIGADKQLVVDDSQLETRKK